MKYLLTGILFVGASQTSLASVYELKFGRVAHADDPETCSEFVEQAAHELAAQADVSIIDSGCRRDDFTNIGLEAIITYRASAPLTVTSTHSASVYSAAFFSSRTECSEHLARQRQLFTDATGLQPLAAYCMLEVSFDQTWETRVDGLGHAEVTPDRAAVTFWGFITDQEAVLADYQAAAADYGIAIFEAGISQGDIGKRIVLRYYASAPYRIEDYDAMRYESVDACYAAATAVHQVLASADKPAVVFCEGSSPYRAAVLHATTFVNVLEPGRVFAARALTATHATMGACQQAADDATDGSGDLLGAVCAGYGGEFRVHLFSRP